MGGVAGLVLGGDSAVLGGSAGGDSDFSETGTSIVGAITVDSSLVAASLFGGDTIFFGGSAPLTGNSLLGGDATFRGEPTFVGEPLAFCASMSRLRNEELRT